MSAADSATAARPARAQRVERPKARTDARGVERSLALGWLAVLPLVLGYEVAWFLDPGSTRNTAEFVITLPFQALLARPEFGRLGLEFAATALAAWSVFHADLALARRVARVVLEGLVAATLLGPLLLVLLFVLGAQPPGFGTPAAVTTPAAAALYAGGAAFEEVVFRAGLLAFFTWAGRATFEWFLGTPRVARVLAEIVALGASAVIFAAAHLDLVVGFVSPGGEPYDGPRFLWRVLAGLALALLFRARGMGVAAWCHAFFNLALVLGAGPEVFL